MIRRRTILALYFFSGISALVYEIVWARMLGLIVGTAVAAWAAVLVAYMGGMALGAFFGGRIADRARRPLMVFAICEAGVGLFGAASPAILHLVQKLCANLPLLPGTSTEAHILFPHGHCGWRLYHPYHADGRHVPRHQPRFND